MAERDIDMVVITGAGASAPLGLRRQLPMMSDWSDALVKAIRGLGPGRIEATGLELGLGPEEFEARLGHFLRSVNAFNQIKDLIGPSAGFQPYGSQWQTINSETLAHWHSTVVGNLEGITNAINKTLYQLFGQPEVDLEKATKTYLDLFQRLRLQPTGSRWVLATTNYDTIGELVIRGLGAMPDWGQPPHMDNSSEEFLNVERLIDGLPRYVPVLHLHGRIGWFRRQDGRIYGSSGTHYDPGFGAPIVMLPDPQKDYGSDAVIQSIWLQFEEVLSRAKRVFILGHSLNDQALIDALKRHVQPSLRLAVSVFADSFGAARDDVMRKIETELNATVVPLSFGSPLGEAAVAFDRWLELDLPA
jgi:hypothetical protein